jgi:hypothetical protein
MHKNKNPWYQADPNFFTTLQREINLAYPQLHFRLRHGSMFLSGSFPLVDGDREVDRYLIEVEFPSHYPKGVPAVYEIGGRIPRTVDRHVYPITGAACLNLPVLISKVNPKGVSLLEFLNGPVRSYFVGQSKYEATGIWPFGQWGHGEVGYYEYYAGVMGTSDQNVLSRFREMIRQKEINGDWSCPCGSGKRLWDCHWKEVQGLHEDYMYYLEQYGWIINKERKLTEEKFSTSTNPKSSHA